MRANIITAIQEVQELPEVETDGEQGVAPVSSATFQPVAAQRAVVFAGTPQSALPAAPAHGGC